MNTLVSTHESDSQGERSPLGTNLPAGERLIFGRLYVDRMRLAEILGCSTRAIDRMRSDRTGPARVRIGGKVWYPADGVSKWLASREEGPVQKSKGRAA